MKKATRPEKKSRLSQEQLVTLIASLFAFVYVIGFSLLLVLLSLYLRALK